MAAARRFVIDTNLYIEGFRTASGRQELEAFLSAFAPFVWLSAVVAQELRAGARGAAGRVLEQAVFLPFERRARQLTPTYAAWKEAGRLLAELVAPSGWADLPRSFVNDALLAASCREAGAVLVTRNLRDFERIAAVRPFEFVAPWPAR